MLIKFYLHKMVELAYINYKNSTGIQEMMATKRGLESYHMD